MILTGAQNRRYACQTADVRFQEAAMIRESKPHTSDAMTEGLARLERWIRTSSAAVLAAC